MVVGIVAHELALNYRNKPLFDNLSFTIQPGQFTAILGASGIGKSSLLRIIAGLIKPHRGMVIGSDNLPLTHRVAYMGQQDLLLPWLNTVDNVCLGARLRGEGKDTKRALDLLAKVHLDHERNHYPNTLSGGMRQRVAIARTLYEQQPIVLMDEPFSALDAITRASIQEMAVELLAKKTVLLVTHDPSEAARLCNTILVLRNQPAVLMEPLQVSGSAPRDVGDPNFVQSEKRLMQLLEVS